MIETKMAQRLMDKLEASGDLLGEKNFFAQLSVANKKRCDEYYHTDGGILEWSILEWAGAMAGEAGEAANCAKKMRRVWPAGVRIRGETMTLNLACKMAEEIADTVIYAGLCLSWLSLMFGTYFDLQEFIVEKFNRVSRELGCDILLPENYEPRGPAQEWANKNHAEFLLKFADLQELADQEPKS